ncbi:MAG: MraY family glycosyltransferase [Spirochaetota bacterium]
MRVAALAFALVGSIGGFLFFNFPKASIFMGDSGSLFLGFILAVLPLLAAGSNPAEIGLLPAATILAVPIFDVFAAIIRRRRRGEHIMEADREHLHHKLMDFGLEARQILATVYAVCLCLGVVVVVAAFILKATQVYATLGALAILAGSFSNLHFAKERAKESSLHA